MTQQPSPATDGHNAALRGNSWRPEMRLKKSRDFRRVQGRGRRFRQPDLLFLFLPGRASCSRIGLTVSKKVGNAVERNRVKRWLREGLRHAYDQLDRTLDVVVIAHPSAATRSAAELNDQIAFSLPRLRNRSGGDGNHRRKPRFRGAKQ